MYQIYSESAKTLTDSSNIRLPRFQRKQTWNDKKNFALCISIFNDYPIGMFVLNEEILKTKDGSMPTLWLLDGRQRRNALLGLYDNPENIYKWARKFIKFKKTDSEDEIEAKFWESIEQHLESDDDEVQIEETQNNNLEVDEEEYDDPNVGLESPRQEYLSTREENEADTKYHSGLNLLLKIILMCHKVEPRYSGYSTVFDFSKFFVSIDYVNKDNYGQKVIDGSTLTIFINSFLSHLDKRSMDDFKSEDFLDFLITRYTLNADASTKSKLERHIVLSWERIKYTIFIVKQLALQLHETKIGIIKLTRSNNSDAQNIFKLINSSGTTLTAVEILSAKPSWNKKISNPSQQLNEAVENLYETLGVKRQGVVLWDYPATLLDRLKNLDFIFPPFDYKVDTQFKSKVTLGFKLLAAIFEGGVTKEKISGLSRSKSINWEEIDKVLDEINLMGKFLKSSPMFQYLRDWDTTLFNLTSEAICLNFLVLVYKNWLEKGSPIGSSAMATKFLNETYVLFDRMIYEYTLKIWRGSSDSKIADNINSFNPRDTFKAIPQQKWLDLLEELIEKETIQDQRAEQKDLKALMYYYYILTEKSGFKNRDEAIEMDHIISQHHFKSTTGESSHRLNNLCNFCLLEKSMNSIKGNRSLHEIHQLAQTNAKYKRLEQAISYGIDIDSNDFTNFSTAQNFDQLVELRKAGFANAFTHNRDRLLN